MTFERKRKPHKEIEIAWSYRSPLGPIALIYIGRKRKPQKETEIYPSQEEGKEERNKFLGRKKKKT